MEKRKGTFGDEANVCDGCTEILICDGPISFGVCRTVDEMLPTGLLIGPKKIPWQRLRRYFLPISKDCLKAYGLGVKDNKLVKLVKEDKND